jgi:Family of unknown function (DUF6084)
MVDLDFAITGAAAEPYAASPLLHFDLLISNKTPALPIENVMLNCQIRIEPTRRRYEPDDHDRLSDLFGEPERWSQTLRGFLWTHVTAAVPGFETDRVFKLPVPCSFDFNVAATKFFHGVSAGDVPLLFLFSGTVFYRDADGLLQITQISWNRESAFRLPVRTWRDLMETYYPNSTWLRIDHDVFEQLYRYKRRTGLATWEQAIQRLLDTQQADVQQ